MEKRKIFCFDFDGTLTTKDTLIEFIRYAKGDMSFFLGFLLHSPILVGMKLHLFPNWKAKQMIFKHFFGGMKEKDFNQICTTFAAHNQHLLRPAGIRFVKDCVQNNHQVMIVSASIDNWVQPFFEQQGLKGIEILGTQIEIAQGKVTGKFKTANCYGAEKVLRITKALGGNILRQQEGSSFTLNRANYYIEAFGDSRGDKEMLAFADKGHYKPFREC